MRYTSSLFAALVLVIAICLTGSCGGGGSQPDEPEKSGKSLIVVAVDGLRADALGCYGNADAATPALDALAAESVTFEQAWSQSPSMMPSLASMLTGLYPTTHGLVEPGHRLATEPKTLAEIVATEGLATAGFVQGAAGGDNFGLGKGFSHFRVGPEPGQAALTWLKEHASEDVFVLIAGFSAANFESPEPAPAGFTQRLATTVMEIAEGKAPALNDDDVQTAKARYAQHVTAIDSALAELVASFRSSGLLDRATLVVAGSSGIAIQEHGNLFSDGLWPETTHVPLLVRAPGGSSGAVTKVVELVDLMPTLAAAAGAASPEGLQGSDLGPIMSGAGSPPYIAFAETDNRDSSRAAIMDGMMYVTADGNTMLYELRSDPAAAHDVSADYPKRAEVLSSHLEAWNKMVAAASFDPERRSEDLDEETLEQLKSLGYIQ